MAPTGLSGTLTPGSEISLQATTACCTETMSVTKTAPLSSRRSHRAALSRTRATQLGSSAAASPTTHASPFESRNNSGDFLRHQNFALHMQSFDGTALNRSDATFCPQPGKDGKGNSFHSVNYPTKYIRHNYGKVYIASDGDGANPWDATLLWTYDTSFIVSPPWSP
jgi:hypothetical protein